MEAKSTYLACNLFVFLAEREQDLGTAPEAPFSCTSVAALSGSDDSHIVRIWTKGRYLRACLQRL